MTAPVRLPKPPMTEAIKPLTTRLPQGGVQGVLDAQKHACDAGENAGNDKGELDDAGGVDAHQLGGVAVKGNRAQRTTQTGFLDDIRQNDQRHGTDAEHH